MQTSSASTSVRELASRFDPSRGLPPLPSSTSTSTTTNNSSSTPSSRNGGTTTRTNNSTIPNTNRTPTNTNTSTTNLSTTTTITNNNHFPISPAALTSSERRLSAENAMAQRRTSHSNLMLQNSRAQDERPEMREPKRRSTANLADQMPVNFQQELLKEEALAIEREQKEQQQQQPIPPVVVAAAAAATTTTPITTHPSNSTTIASTTTTSSSTTATIQQQQQQHPPDNHNPTTTTTSPPDEIIRPFSPTNSISSNHSTTNNNNNNNNNNSTTNPTTTTTHRHSTTNSVSSSVASLPPTLESLPELTRQMNSNIVQQELFATMSLRVMLSHHVSWIEKIVEVDGLVNKLVEFLSRDDQKRLQFESTWAITNIASGTSVHTLMVVEAGAIPPLIKLLDSPQIEIREQAVWALGNIAGDSPDTRDKVLNLGIIPILVHRLDVELSLKKHHVSFLRNAVWTIANLTRGKPPPNFDLVKPTISVLGRVLTCPVRDAEMLADAAWALNYLGDGDSSRVQALIDEGVCGTLVELMGHEAYIVKGPALRAVGNIVTGDDNQTEHILNLGALDRLRVLLTDARHTIRGEACWTVSNITAGNYNQIQRVFDAQLIPSLIECCKDPETYVAREAVWAVTNATSGGTPEQVTKLGRAGAIQGLVTALQNSEELNNRVVIVALEGLSNLMTAGDLTDPFNNEFVRILKDCGGEQLLKNDLRHHVNDDIRVKAHELVTRFIDYQPDNRPAKPPPELWTPEEVAMEKEKQRVEREKFDQSNQENAASTTTTTTTTTTNRRGSTFIPPQFYCPISQEIMTDPVSTVDGHVYDRINIQRWFNTGKMTSPVTGQVLASTLLVPNHPIRQMIEAFKPGFTHRADLDTEWNCVACTMVNKPTDTMCLTCGAEKPPRKVFDPDAIPAARRIMGEV
jgi:importin subunit alpha-1